MRRADSERSHSQFEEVDLQSMHNGDGVGEYFGGEETLYAARDMQLGIELPLEADGEEEADASQQGRQRGGRGGGEAEEARQQGRHARHFQLPLTINSAQSAYSSAAGASRIDLGAAAGPARFDDGSSVEGKGVETAPRGARGRGVGMVAVGGGESGGGLESGGGGESGDESAADAAGEEEELIEPNTPRSPGPLGKPVQELEGVVVGARGEEEEEEELMEEPVCHQKEEGRARGVVQAGGSGGAGRGGGVEVGEDTHSPRRETERESHDAPRTPSGSEGDGDEDRDSGRATGIEEPEVGG